MFAASASQLTSAISLSYNISCQYHYHHNSSQYGDGEAIEHAWANHNSQYWDGETIERVWANTVNAGPAAGDVVEGVAAVGGAVEDTFMHETVD